MPMESPCEFLQRFLSASRAAVEAGAAEFAAFRKSFYAEECALVLRREQAAAERLAGMEVIVTTSNAGITAEAVTVTIVPNGTIVVYRYRLKLRSKRWAIGGMDVLCPECHGGRGKHDCGICSGEGWTPLGYKLS
jgi:hypothetical protein